jgi:hypothetical protein
LAARAESVHTFGMSLKNAALFAVVGMVLFTLLVSVALIRNVSGLISGFIPPVTVLISLIEWVASLSLLVFFIVFHKTQ